MELSINDPYYKEKTKTLCALYQVIDPELFVNIIDLGLVWDPPWDPSMMTAEGKAQLYAF